MPLRECCSDECISDNIAELIRAGHDRDQAVAIAMSKCGRSVRTTWLWRWRLSRQRAAWAHTAIPIETRSAAVDDAKKQATIMARQCNAVEDLAVQWAMAADSWDHGDATIDEVRAIRDQLEHAKDVLIKLVEEL